MTSLSDFLDRLEVFITGSIVIISQGILVSTRLGSRLLFCGFLDRLLPKLCVLLFGQGNFLFCSFLRLQLLAFEFRNTSILDRLTIASPAIMRLVGFNEISVFNLTHQEAEESGMATGEA